MTINPQVGSAIIGGVGSLIGSLFGSKSNSDTNKTNLKIAQMNNEFNERMMQKQMDYNTEMWNAENEYNTAENQVARYKAAGLNPALMMQNGGSAGMASTANNVTPAQANNVQMSPYDYGGMVRDAASTASSIMSSLSDAQQKEAITQGIRVENRYKEQYLNAEIAQMLSNSKNSEAMATFNSFQAQNYQQWINSQIGVADSQRRLNEAQINYNVSQAALTDVLKDLRSKDLKYYDQDFNSRMMLIGSQILMNNASAYKSRQDAVESVSRTMYNYAMTQGQRISNGVAYRSADALVRRASLENQRIEYDAEKLKWNAGTAQKEFNHYDVTLLSR